MRIVKKTQNFMLWEKVTPTSEKTKIPIKHENVFRCYWLVLATSSMRRTYFLLPEIHLWLQLSFFYTGEARERRESIRKHTSTNTHRKHVFFSFENITFQWNYLSASKLWFSMENMNVSKKVNYFFRKYDLFIQEYAKATQTWDELTFDKWFGGDPLKE